MERALIFLFMWGIFWISNRLLASQYGGNNGYSSQPLPSTHLRFNFFTILTDLIEPFTSSRVDFASWLIKQISESRDMNCGK